MKTSFVIYSRAVGLYAVFTLPVLFSFEIYLTSLRYVLTYGWFAWLLFTLSYLLIDRIIYDFGLKLFSLFIAVVIAVAFAYHLLGILEFGESEWRSLFIFFPFVAVIGGWISVCISKEKIRSSCMSPEQADVAGQNS